MAVHSNPTLQEVRDSGWLENPDPDSTLRMFTVLGVKVKAHNAGCAQSFREDRKAGLIYGRVCDADDHSKVYGWEEGSMELGFCVYCG